MQDPGCARTQSLTEQFLHLSKCTKAISSKRVASFHGVTGLSKNVQSVDEARMAMRGAEEQTRMLESAHNLHAKY